MINVDSIKQSFLDFAFQGLDHGINSIADSGGPLIPFVLTQSGDKRKLQRFVTERYEDGPIEAESYLKGISAKPDMALIAFDGFVTLEGQRSDAILVRCFDKHEIKGIILAQRYQLKDDGKGITPFGNATLLGETENLIYSTVTIPPVSDKHKKPWWKF